MKQNVGNNIRLLRQRNALTQRQVADRIGVSPKTISSWESNRTEPDMGKVMELCKILQCKSSEIIGDIVPKKKQDYLYWEFLEQNPEYSPLMETITKVPKKDIRRLLSILNAFLEK